MKGALRDGDGIVAALGTGSVFARQVGGRMQQIGGWGLHLGDEGSGAWIGRAVLARALRALDGLAERTPLLQALMDEAGGPAGLVTLAAGARPADFARFAPRVIDSDDPAAVAVMAQAEADVAASVAVLQEGGALPRGVHRRVGADLCRAPCRAVAGGGALGHHAGRGVVAGAGWV